MAASRFAVTAFGGRRGADLWHTSRRAVELQLDGLEGGVATAEEPAEALAEVLGEKGVEQRVDATVHVGEASGRDAHADECHRLAGRAKVLNEEHDVYGQPAQCEHDDDDDDHVRDASLVAHALGRAT